MSPCEVVQRGAIRAGEINGDVPEQPRYFLANGRPSGSGSGNLNEIGAWVPDTGYRTWVFLVPGTWCLVPPRMTKLSYVEARRAFLTNRASSIANIEYPFCITSCSPTFAKASLQQEGLSNFPMQILPALVPECTVIIYRYINRVRPPHPWEDLS